MSSQPKRRLPTMAPGIGTIDGRTARPEPKRVDPYYKTAAHERWRAEVIARAGGRCEWRLPDGQICGVREPRMYADHIHERKDGGADQGPGMCMCPKHHAIKTIRERTRRTAEPVSEPLI